jgi:peptidoglycan/LPS O-acetylase OafA/YrhL
VMGMDVLGAFVVLAGLVLLLVWTSRRWGRPRLYVRGTTALWLVAAILAGVIVMLLVLD